MTFDDDFVRLNFSGGRHMNVLLKKLDLEWPPPERLHLNAIEFKRIGLSSITDEQRGEMTHVCRGAEYNSEQLMLDEIIEEANSE